MKNIVILATGGTIAGAGELGKNIGYKSGSIKAQTLIDAIPELKNVANICVEQFCNINSDDITSELWIALAKRIQELLQREDVDGIVVMHGTDTMEETALFLNLVLNAAETAAKPVILTGSMRPATASKPDGPANLLFAVKSAADLSEKNDATIYVAFAGKLMNARSVQKIHANDLDAFAELSSRTSFRNRHLVTAKKSFDISNLRELPRVTVLYFNADADAELVRFAAERSVGLIIAGSGAGEFSREWADAIADAVAEKNIPVVISTRINRGRIVPEQLLVPGTIAAYDLPPAKAAVLLRLALTVTNDSAEIQEMFSSQ
jgi:L-asparaginase